MASSAAWAACRNIVMMPFVKYNQLLDRRPTATKCVTSAFMYGLGDICAQKAEHYNKGKEAAEKGEGAPEFHVDWSRAGVFFTFGLLIGGPAVCTRTAQPAALSKAFLAPAFRELPTLHQRRFVLLTPVYKMQYTAWFARLDMLPAQLWALRNARQRAEIMRAYNLLKRHGIDVNLRMDRLVRLDCSVATVAGYAERFLPSSRRACLLHAGRGRCQPSPNVRPTCHRSSPSLRLLSLQPDARPLSKWAAKAFKIAADQFIFSTTYTLVFFLAIGMMNVRVVCAASAGKRTQGSFAPDSSISSSCSWRPLA